MIHKCPHCTAAIPWHHRHVGPLDACQRCGSILRRYVPDGAVVLCSVIALLVTFIVFAILAGLNWLGHATSTLALFALTMLGQIGLMLLLLQQCRVAEPGRTYCRHCSYDLTGNITGVCPECGKPTDGNVADSVNR